jgi:hypothetical protein
MQPGKMKGYYQPSIKNKGSNKKKKDKNHPHFDVRGYLEKIHGVDVLAIYGLSDIGGLELLGETQNRSK